MTKIIKNDFNQKELKSKLTTLKENATQVESISTISAICKQLSKYILTKNSPVDDEFELPIRNSELTKYCYELAEYDKSANRNSTFENIVTIAIRTAMISVSPKYKTKQNLVFSDNSIEVASKYKSPLINVGLKADKTIDWQENKSNTMLTLNVADLIALNKDIIKGTDENRKKRQVKTKQDQNLGRKIMLGFENLRKDLISNFKKSNKGGDIWDNKTILEKIGSSQIEAFEKDLQVMISFVNAVKLSHGSTDNNGNIIEVEMGKVRDKFTYSKSA